MKLYVIGTSQQAQIRPASQYVSGYHAELLLLDNGDMLLTDRGSKNGTYVNGKKLTPDKDVNVRRGDDVKFADATLDWSQIPSNTVDMTRVQEIRSIGSHYMNKIQLHGDHVSRFHATLKKMKDGKWYIQDHSMNGTKVNGSPIPKEQDFRIKRGDVITCAGVPVKNPIPPLPENLWGVLGGILGVAACIALAVLLIKPWPIKPNYGETVAMIATSYHFEIYVDGELEDKVYDDSFGACGTGFFISQDGKLVTNLHVAKNWMYKKDLENIKKELQIAFYALGNEVTATATSKYDIEFSSLITSKANSIEVIPVVDEIYVIPNGKVISPENAISATIIAASDNIHVDVAVIQLNTEKLPEDTDYVKKVLSSDEDVKVGDEVFVYGFPKAIGLQLSGEKILENNRIKLEAYLTDGSVIRSGNDVNFEHNVMVEKGSSGSPIFNSKGVLVGVVSASHLNTENPNYNIGINASLINEVLNKKPQI